LSTKVQNFSSNWAAIINYILTDLGYYYLYFWHYYHYICSSRSYTKYWRTV